MTLPIPSALPADVAERRRDRDEARREKFVVSPEKALDDLVDRIMDGQSYPKRGTRYTRVDLDSILCDLDGAELSSMIRESILGGDKDWLKTECEKIVRAWLDGSDFVDMRQREMADEAEEESHD